MILNAVYVLLIFCMVTVILYIITQATEVRTLAENCSNEGD